MPSPRSLKTAVARCVAVVVLVVVTGSPATASAASACPSGNVVYSTKALKLVAGRGHTPSLTVCRPATSRRANVTLPSDAASIVRVQRFGSLIAVLMTRSTASGGGIVVLELSAAGKAGATPVVVTGTEVEDLAVRGFAVAQHVPFVAVVLKGGLVKTFAVAGDGSTTPFGQAQAYSRADPTSLRLDPSHGAVKWTPSYKNSATVVASLLASPGCAVGGTDIKVTPEIRVFKVHEEYWACELKTGKVTNLSTPNIDNFNYDAPGAPFDLKIVGHFVLYGVSIGFDPDVVENFIMVADVENARVTAPFESSPSDTDSIEPGNAGADGVELTDTGTIALVDWIFYGGADQQAALCPSLPIPNLLAGKLHNEWVMLVVPFGGKTRALDCQSDPVIEKTTGDPRSPTIANLALDGHTLGWTSVGQPRSAPIE